MTDTTWNYRVVEDEVCGATTYSIREVYYNRHRDIISWTTVDNFPFGETLSELKQDLEYMQEALSRPVLKMKNGVLHEV